MTDKQNSPCPFCGGRVDPEGWLRGDGARGPECESCGATAPTLAVWNSAQQADPVARELIAEAWRLMDGQDPNTAAWHFAASAYLRAAPLEQVDRPAEQPTYTEYVTLPGESLMGIAARQLKAAGFWVEIRDLNAHAFPNMGPHYYYPVGTKLRLPAVDQVQP
ncbi:hypothetical protein [Pseudomonas syringae]|nr:hypothetical protein [Pseudomonas syringae]